MSVKTLDIDIDHDRLLAEYIEHNWQQSLIDIQHTSTVLNQISLQKTVDCSIETERFDSCGSLMYDWDSHDSTDPNSKPQLRKNVRREADFNILCSEFKGTYLGEVVELLHKEYNAVRGRMMALDWKTCLTIHRDSTQRIHIPIVTDENCMMLIDDKVHRLSSGNTYLTDTTKPHTAFNASKIYRTHLVFCTDMFKGPRKQLPWELVDLAIG